MFISSLVLYSGVAAGVSACGSPTASIQNGVLIGTTTSLPAATATVNKFLGVPYAQSPTRFAAPVAASAWSQPRNASKFGPACIQQAESALGAFSYKEPEQSEDCLYLNVWQPSGNPPNWGWPVMVWIYGGGLQFGSSDDPGYDGAAFAAYEDVVFVSMNYRLSVFGFPGAPNVPNLGFLDQRLALAWIKDNIKAFSGDAAKVTMFGESSGGISVSSLLAVPPAPVPFHAAIVQSGTVLSNALSSLGQDAAAVWNKTVTALNCSRAVDPVACVRTVPADALQAYANNASFATVAPER